VSIVPSAFDRLRTAMDAAFVSEFAQGQRVFRFVDAIEPAPIVMPDGHAFGTLCCFSAAPNEALKMRDLMTLRHCAQLVARKLVAVRERQQRSMQGTEIMAPDWALEPIEPKR